MTQNADKNAGSQPSATFPPYATDSTSHSGIGEYIASLLASESLGPQITNHTVLPEKTAAHRELTRPWPKAMSGVLEALGIPDLYSHQALAIDSLRAGNSIVVATPTASGKSMIYTLPVLERFLSDPDARSLFLFPLKALAQDQLASFTAMTEHWAADARPRAAVYDGDTSPHFRKKLRENPPEVLLTNPEMLHLSLLPHHHLWTTLFAGLSLVVVDEVHTYRGVFGSHMAQVFRRLMRVAALYGSSPAFCFCSATVGNPAELASLLTGAEPEAVLESGAPQGKRHYLFMNPFDSASTAAIKLLKAALARGLRTIVYCQSRRMTELISLWAAQQSGPYASRISAYRAGFLPEERRAIEEKMSSGELLAVISTSALELGIDIGDLDLCILVGYPGTVMATLQRGGRVGRSSQESAVILVAQEDALDQYIVRHAADFFKRPPEQATLNPENEVLLERHLECAAAELPLRPEGASDSRWMTPAVLQVAAALEEKGVLLRSADGTELYAARKRPQRHISLRGSGNSVTIEDGGGNIIGSVDGIRALREAHPGSVYLHLGKYYEVVELDIPGGRALAKPCRPTWYTHTRSRKETEILSLDGQRLAAGIPLQRGRLRITDHVTGYEKRSMKTRQLLGVTPLDLPPVIFETEGFWLQVPPRIQRELEDARMHFMGAIHALEHAAIGILPLFVMSDRNDFGGISTPMHAQTGRPTVFIYDGMPGGAGLCRAAFASALDFFRQVLPAVADCPCETGCPSCVHSPKCGSGNRPLDKEGTIRLLSAMLEDTPQRIAEARELLASPPSGLQARTEPSASGMGKERHPTESLPNDIQDIAPELVRRKMYPAAHELPSETTAVFLQKKNADALESQPPVSLKYVPHESVGDDTTLDAKVAFETMEISGGCCFADPREAGEEMHMTDVPDTDGRLGQITGEQDADFSHFVVLDVETRYSAAEVGGWGRASRMGVSVAVLYDSRTDAFTAYKQEDIPALAAVLEAAPLVVGFNIMRFDYTVLEPHAPGFAFRSLPTLDMLMKVHEQLSYRLSLDNLAKATLGAPKSADGLQALQWWKEQRLEEIEEYCRKDVELTRDLYLYGRQNGFLLFTNKAGKAVRVRATWQG